MKAKMMLGFLLVALGTGFRAAAFDGGPIPLCRPGVPCVDKRLFDGDPQPMCRPGIPCQSDPKKFDSDPEPLCRPGVPCSVGTSFGVARQFSGEPIPPCKPGINCPILK